MRRREQGMIEDVADLINQAANIVATFIETRDVDEEDALGYDLRILYSELNRLLDDAEELGHDL
jgi:hypothetical protein